MLDRYESNLYFANKFSAESENSFNLNETRNMKLWTCQWVGCSSLLPGQYLRILPQRNCDCACVDDVAVSFIRFCSVRCSRFFSERQRILRYATGANVGVRQNARSLVHTWTSQSLVALRCYVAAECAGVDPALGCKYREVNCGPWGRTCGGEIQWLTETMTGRERSRCCEAERSLVTARATISGLLVMSGCTAQQNDFRDPAPRFVILQCRTVY
jgi:hypothetical protein